MVDDLEGEVSLALPNIELFISLVAVGVGVDINVLSTFINPQAEDISIAKSESPNVIDKFG